MKRFFTALLLIAMLFSMPAASASADAPTLAVTPEPAQIYYAVSCFSDGEDYSCEGEYLELRADGTGLFCFCGTPYNLDWMLGAEPITYESEGALSEVWPLSFIDCDGDEFSGYYFPEGIVYGTYRDYEYAFAAESLLHPESEEAAAFAGGFHAVPDPEAAAADALLPYRSFFSGDDYIVLNNDGTGVWFYYGEAVRITAWTSEGERIRIDAYDGTVMTGTLSGSTLYCSDGYNARYYTAIPGVHPPVTRLAPERWNADLPSVFDEADILTDEQERTLALRADEISRANGCNVYIIALDDYRDYTDAYSLYSCDEEIRTGYNLGYGADKSCICLFLSMNARDYDLLTFGDFASTAFTDYGKSRLESAFLDDFSNDNWYSGLADYLETCESLLQPAVAGRPVDLGSSPLVNAFGIVACAVLGFLPAMGFCLLQKRRMQAVAKNDNANAYVPAGGIEFTYRRDQYIRTTTSRRYSPRNSGGSGGGRSGGSRGGHSHRGGKF